MPQNAQNIKVSNRAWELLRWAKFELDVKSYSDVIILMNNRIENRSKSLEKALLSFDEERHRIKVKTPDDHGDSRIFYEKPKTILLRPDTHKILNRLKIESNQPAYTFSDAIEFLVRENKDIWNNLPNRLKNQLK